MTIGLNSTLNKTLFEFIKKNRKIEEWILFYLPLLHYLHEYEYNESYDDEGNQRY
jgi:hypothetical protein